MPSSRREFLKTAAVAGTVAGAGALITGTASAATPPVDKDLEGVIEMYVHAPDVRVRGIDQFVLLCERF